MSIDNPQAASEPSADAALEAEVLDVFSAFGGEDSVLDLTETASPPAVTLEGPSSEGEAVAAPSASPEPSPASTEAAPPAVAEPAPAPPQPSPAPAAQEPPAAAPQPSLVVDERALREASLIAQRDALARQLEQLQANPQTAPAQPAPNAAESGEPPAGPKYTLALPQQVQAAILSDDPAQNVAAINAIVNDLGTIVHSAVVTQMRQEFKTELQALMRSAGESETVEKQAKTIEQLQEDYYTAFPDHKHPLVLPLIQAESQKLALELPGLSWNEEFRNALGARVQATIDQLSGKAAAPVVVEPPQPVNPAPPPRPAAFLPAGNRGGAAAPGSEQAGTDLIEDTLRVI